VDINDEWSDNENLIVGGPIDIREDSDTILEIIVKFNTIPQNQLVRR